MPRGSSREDLVRAAVESMAPQTADVLGAMATDPLPPNELRVDGGASVMDALVQFQADLCGIAVVRAGSADTTAGGAAYLAGLATGLWSVARDIPRTWAEAARFVPEMGGSERGQRLAGGRG